jgi:hypothetical protein
MSVAIFHFATGCLLHNYFLAGNIPFGGGSSLLLWGLFIQESEQAVEDHACLLQPFAIISECLAQTIDDRLNTTSFEPLELVIF